MHFKSLFTCAVAVAVYLSSPQASPTRMPVQDVRPGMEGIGITVFNGRQREEFKVQIIGVLENITGPRRNLILAKLSGGPLEETGVIQGMSGSPVYINDRLVGAVSYSLGAFAKEPIAGITPIEEMIRDTSVPNSRAVTHGVSLAIPVTQQGLADIIRQTFSYARPFADSPSDIRTIGLPVGTGEQMGTMLKPIATPLLISGFNYDVIDLLAGGLHGLGFAPFAGGFTNPPILEPEEPLQPGDPVGASLISGDLTMAGTGTVTLVEEGRVYAFGHPFYNLGPTQFPMMRAYVQTLLPSLAQSSKISGLGEIIGTFDQDRSTAIAGTLGTNPSLVPIAVKLKSLDNNRSETFNFQLVKDPLFTPLLTYITILNTLSSYERERGAVTFFVEGKARIDEHPDVIFEDIFTGEAPSINAATYISAPVASLLGNNFEQVNLSALNITITSVQEPRTATLERIWLDESNPQPGQTIPLKMLIRTYRNDETTRTLSIAIPPNATGTLSLLVSDGSELAIQEQNELRKPLDARSVGQMIRAINTARKNKHLYIKLISEQPGAVVNGEILSSLPASVLEVFEANRNSGDFIPLTNATLGEWYIEMDHAISGSRLLEIDLNAG